MAKSKVGPRGPRLTPDQKRSLWDGSIEEVAARLGRTVQMISASRRRYAKFNPNPDSNATPGSARVKKSTGNKGPRKAVRAAKKIDSNVASRKTTDVSGFIMKIGNETISFPTVPKKVKIGNMELEF